MVYKRIIYSLLYSKGFFHLSRNFRLQQVGDVEWLKNNFGFGETCDYIDELMITLVTKNPDKNEINNYFKDVKKLKEKIIKFRQDELDHKDIAYDNGATKKGLFGILDKVIKTSSRIAITISEKI